MLRGANLFSSTGNAHFIATIRQILSTFFPFHFNTNLITFDEMNEESIAKVNRGNEGMNNKNRAIFERKKIVFLQLALLLTAFLSSLIMEWCVLTAQVLNGKRKKEIIPYLGYCIYALQLCVCVHDWKMIGYATYHQACVAIENVSIKLMNDLKVGRHVICASFVYKISLLFLFVSCCR